LHRIGVDIIEVARIDGALERFGNRFLERIYTGPELTLCKDKANRLAARFAAKEAVMKALGTGVKGVSWREIEVLSKPSGEPEIRLYGKARIIANGLGLDEFAVSLSHSKEYAVATVIATSS
jgi:holo-[acyl-carrier protein] synthase